MFDCGDVLRGRMIVLCECNPSWAGRLCRVNLSMAECSSVCVCVCVCVCDCCGGDCGGS